MEDNFRNELIGAMETLAKEGFRCFILKDDPSFLYGFAITPNDNVIYIQRDTFKWRGWTFTFEYIPSKETGSGCQCFEDPVFEITKEILLQAETEGLQFARRLGAKFYNSSNEFLEKLWNKTEFEEIF